MNKSLLYNTAIICFLFVPLSFIFGIFITEVLVLVSTIFFFSQKKKFHYLKDTKIILLFIFSLYVGLNGLFNSNYLNFKISAVFHFRYVLLSISICYILNLFLKRIKFSQNILLIFFIFIVLIIFDSLIQFFYGKNILGFEIISNRVSSFFGDELILGSFLLRVLPLILLVIFYLGLDLNKYKNYLILFFGVYFIVIYLAGSRTSFALLLLFVFLLLISLSKVKIIFKNALFVLLFFITITSLFNIGQSLPFNRLFIKTFNQITNQYHVSYQLRDEYILNGHYKKNERKNLTKVISNLDLKKIFKSERRQDKLIDNIKIFSQDHNGHYLLAYKLFTQKPIFGHGPKGFRSYCRSVKFDPQIGICSTHPHNIIAQIIAELGITGLIFYIIFIIFIIKKFFEAIKLQNSVNKDSFLISSISLFIIFFPLLPSGNLFNNGISIIYYYFIGIYIYTYNRLFH